MRLGGTAIRLNGALVQTDSQLVEVYRRRLAVHGFSGETMFYRYEAQHQAKIDQYVALLRKTVTAGESLLDVGCGYGSLAPHLSGLRYTGIDIVPEFIVQAQKSCRGFDFRLQNIADCMESFDWCVLLGVVNAIPNPRRVLELSWQRCQRGMLVDFVDQEKLAGPVPNLNSFDLRECADTLFEIGARTVEVHTTTNVWNIFLARKHEKPVVHW